MKLSIREGSNPNYLATVARVGKLSPITGADKLVKTVINGYDIIVSKDFHEGDVVIYFPLESVICEKYLGANNLYDMARYELNANKEEVYDLLNKSENLPEDDAEGKKALLEQAKALCGFFTKTGRVRILKLRGAYSQGFVAKIDSVEKAWPELAGTDWEATVGTQFNLIGKDNVCWKYVPPMKITPPTLSSAEKRENRLMKLRKKLKEITVLIDGQFEFHYDSKMLAEHFDELSPDDVVTISVKVHGSSAILANVLVKRPLSTWEKIKKFFGFKVRDTEYKNLYSSRRVIKNKNINPNAMSFYDNDIWAHVERDFGPYIPEGMTVYGEIAGYKEGESGFIQENHDYGCLPGEWKFMPYRITMTGTNGEKTEWNLEDVDDWTKKLVKEHPELKTKVLPLTILYHGKLRDLYPDIYPDDPDWHARVLERMKNDKDRFLMEVDEPLCIHKVPREGIVIRRDNDVIPRAWKLKTSRHYALEGKQHDAGKTDIEEEN